MKPERPVSTERWGYENLKGTSQGGVFDLPPEHWIDEELFMFDTKRKNDIVNPPGLRQEVHSVFARKSWRNISDERYGALHQSMVLATNLINLSGPVFACFFPSFRQNTKRGVRSSVVPDDECEFPTPGQQERWSAALGIFEQKARTSVTWWEDSTMLTREGWLGINMPGTAVPPFSPKTHWDWQEADELAGYPETRRVGLGLTSEFADTILANPPGSAKHLLASFYAGVTMMHELGHWCVSHVIYPDAPLHGEAYFGDNLEMEMGNSWISWLFGCQMHPEPITLERVDRESRSSNLFNHGLLWYPTYKCGDTKPLYVTQYSIPLSYIEDIMSPDIWEGHDLLNFTASMRRGLIGPKREMFREGRVARVATSFRSKPWMDSPAFARPGQARHINWDHAPLRYVDFILSEKKRPENNQKRSSDIPVVFSKLVYKLHALRSGRIPNDRRTVRRETDQVDMGECDSDELETVEPISSSRYVSHAHHDTSGATVEAGDRPHRHNARKFNPTSDNIKGTDLTEDDDPNNEVVVLGEQLASPEFPLSSAPLRKARVGAAGHNLRAVSSGRVTKNGRHRPKSITVSEPRRGSIRQGGPDDRICLASRISKNSSTNIEGEADYDLRLVSPNLNRTSSDTDVDGSTVDNDITATGRKASSRRKRRSVANMNKPTSRSRTSANRSSARAKRKSSGYIPPVPSVPDDIELKSSKFSTRLPKLRKKRLSTVTSGTNRSSASVPRRTSSEVSTNPVIGRGTAQSPRRLGNKSQPSGILYKPGFWPFGIGNSDLAKSEKAKRRQSESAEAEIKTPEWQEFDMQRMRIFYPRTRSQSRSMAQGAVRRKSSAAFPSPRTLIPDGKSRRESSVMWERKYGKGHKGWDRRKSLADPRRVNRSSQEKS